MLCNSELKQEHLAHIVIFQCKRMEDHQLKSPTVVLWLLCQKLLSLFFHPVKVLLLFATMYSGKELLSAAFQGEGQHGPFPLSFCVQVL